MSVNTGDIEIVGKQVISLYNEVVSLAAVYGVACNLEVAGCDGRELVAHELYLKRVREVDWIEYSLKIMIIIGSLGDNVQSQIDFSAWKVYHIIGD